jgi:metal-responsive CopG/Arc/MetJ family transcriptional regulator
MNSSKNLSRITIDIPETDHKKFKALAALKGKSMRELVVEAIKNHLKEDEKLEEKSKK